MEAPSVSVLRTTFVPEGTTPAPGLAVTASQTGRSFVVSPTATWVAAVREVPSREKVNWPAPGSLPLKVRVALPFSSVSTEVGTLNRWEVLDAT